MFSFYLSSQFPIFILLEMKSYEDKRLNKVNLSSVIHWIKLILQNVVGFKSQPGINIIALLLSVKWFRGLSLISPLLLKFDFQPSIAEQSLVMVILSPSGCRQGTCVVFCLDNFNRSQTIIDPDHTPITRLCPCHNKCLCNSRLLLESEITRK